MTTSHDSAQGPAGRLRVIMLCPEVPYPPVHGGRVENANCIDALVGRGVEVGVFVVMHAGEGLETLRAVHPGVSASLWPRRSNLLSTLRWPTTPLQISSRRLTRQARKVLEVMTHDSDVVLVASEHMLEIALAVRVRRPIVLRAHNVEWLYLSELSRSDVRFAKRLYYRAESRRLRRFAAAHADDERLRFVASMTQTDADALSALGYHRVTVLPPFALSSRRARITSKVLRARFANPIILFVGGLFMPNTAQGLLWFVNTIWPDLLLDMPQARLVVCGRRPPSSLVRQLRSVTGVSLHADPPSIDPYYERATVFVNPALRGSGANLKNGAPLANGIPVITTTFGARGYRAGNGLFAVDSPANMRRLIVDLLTDWGQYQRAASEAQGYAMTLDPATNAATLERLLRTAADSEQ